MNSFFRYTITIALIVLSSGMSLGYASDLNNNNNNYTPSSPASITGCLDHKPLALIGNGGTMQAFHTGLSTGYQSDRTTQRRLLSLDGGGLRGLIFLPQLRALEIITGKPIYQLFDVIGGTSTGGICAVALSFVNENNQVLSSRDLINLYLKCGPEIFPETHATSLAGMVHESLGSIIKKIGIISGSKYQPDGLEAIASRIVGTAKFNRAHFKVPVLITAVNSNNRQLKIFSSVNKEDAGVDVVKVIRATSAAQTYFPPIQIGETLYIDGGHLANHPARDFRDYYVRELAEEFKFRKGISIFSFGTGDASQIKESSELRGQWLLGKIESTIQILFSKQESDTNAELIREARLSAIKNGLMLTKHELEEIHEMNERHHVYMNSEDRKPGPGKQQASYEVKFKEDLLIRQSNLLSKVTDYAEMLKDEGVVQNFYRSQTRPLPPELLEMDDVKLARSLFEEGLDMVKSVSFKMIIKAIMGENFEIADSVLTQIVEQIGTEADLVDLNDTKPLTMISIINDYLTKRKEGRLNSESYFSEIMQNNGITDVNSTTLSKLEVLLGWTYALLDSNADHTSERSFVHKKSAYGKIWADYHHEIEKSLLTIKENCLQRMAQILGEKNNKVRTSDFSDRSLVNALVNRAVYESSSYSEEDSEADPVLVSCKRNIMDPLDLNDLKVANRDHLLISFWLLEEVKTQIMFFKSGSYLSRTLHKDYLERELERKYVSTLMRFYQVINNLQLEIKTKLSH